MESEKVIQHGHDGWRLMEFKRVEKDDPRNDSGIPVGRYVYENLDRRVEVLWRPLE